ncbi:hypothetical protein [Pseudozobellia thermophila]|uniref:Uncharacterized protein n=1 Tax=Pseudozobellia thermophila TaxID=192903 RepID=A0A1M6LTT1_9FLAO|nr:hypothetical protein [Pseudozobellia thermophila]SHJ74593.1 hypothetical protein SAMN04488513_10848 [Pseudozobellia thermophila]
MPRLALYYIENHKIEIVKTLLGREKVLLNGTKVSEKKSKPGVEHIFSVNKNHFRISRRNPSQADKMNAYEIFKDGVPLALINVEQGKALHFLIFILIVGVGCGYLFGVFLYQLFFSPFG